MRFSRSDGYDLQRGPVFYEAYYPKNVESTASAQQLTAVEANARRRYSNAVQKIRQSLEEPAYGVRHEGASAEPRDQRSFAGDYDWSSQPSQPTDSSGSLIDISRESNELANRIIAKGLVESLRQDTISRSASTNFGRPYPRNNYEDNSNGYPGVRLDEAINVILSAVRNGALKIPEDRLIVDSTLKNEDMRLASRERLVGSDDLAPLYRPSVRPDVSDLGEKKGAVLSAPFERTSGDEYSDVRGPISGLALGRMDNIFQPRPQVISYVFSPTKASPQTTNGDMTQTRSIRSNERVTRNYGDNTVDVAVKAAASSGIASLEVAEIPHRNKVRHHHGEKPRRDRRHRQAAARN